MKMLVVVGLVVALVAVAVMLSTPGGQKSKGGSSPSTSQTPVEVIWRGYITAVVVDGKPEITWINQTPVITSIGPSRTEWFFDFGNGTHVRLDLSNATLRLRDHFAVYVGNPKKPVYVRGLWNGTVLKALEVYD